jgi:peptidoglycan pentaglycine glycine transferase (the first glycine)
MIFMDSLASLIIPKTIGAHDYVFYDRLADTIIGLLEKL